MNCDPSLCKALLKELIAQCGAATVGVTTATPITTADADAYRRWITRGHNGTMDYLSRYDDVRRNPALLLDGARTVLVAAFPYSPENPQPPGTPRIARYALGEDYHTVLRRRLAPAVELIEQDYGGTARVCVDTAPVRERLLAVRAGVGFIGRNGMLIVPGKGSYMFLAEIVTTLALEPDTPCGDGCGDCGRCVAACPGRALDDERGGVDARRCLSYLTIEYRGERLPDDCRPGERLYGCDVCQEVCPHNRGPLPGPLPEFMPREELTALTAEQIATLTPGDYKRLTRNSAMSRVRLPQLLRNLRATTLYPPTRRQ